MEKILPFGPSRQFRLSGQWPGPDSVFACSPGRCDLVPADPPVLEFSAL